jgi:hypothetical protein
MLVGSWRVAFSDIMCLEFDFPTGHMSPDIAKIVDKR